MTTIRAVLLIIGINAIAYAQAHDDTQFWIAVLGGVCIGAYVSLGDIK